MSGIVVCTKRTQRYPIRMGSCLSVSWISSEKSWKDSGEMTELHHRHFEGHSFPGTKKAMLGLLQHAVTQGLSSVLSSRRVAKGALFDILGVSSRIGRRVIGFLILDALTAMFLA